jgi:serine protein kinase
MSGTTRSGKTEANSHFIDSLAAFAQEHRAKSWQGTVRDYLETIVPQNPGIHTRTSHQYIWDMLRWHGREKGGGENGDGAISLFHDELFGINDALERVIEYFKAASTGMEVGRRLLLLLGPPSGGKSTLAIMLKRGLEEQDGRGRSIRSEGLPVTRIPASPDSPHLAGRLQGNVRGQRTG